MLRFYSMHLLWLFEHLFCACSVTTRKEGRLWYERSKCRICLGRGVNENMCKKKKKKRQIYSKYHVHEGQMSFWGILGNCFTNSSLILYILLLLLSSTLFIDIMAKTSEHGCRGYSNGKIECWNAFSWKLKGWFFCFFVFIIGQRYLPV